MIDWLCREKKLEQSRSMWRVRRRLPGGAREERPQFLVRSRRKVFSGRSVFLGSKLHVVYGRERDSNAGDLHIG